MWSAMILGIGSLDRRAIADLSQPAFRCFAAAIDLLLDILRILVGAMPIKNAAIVGLDLARCKSM